MGWSWMRESLRSRHAAANSALPDEPPPERIFWAPVGIGGVAHFSGPRGCVNMIQLFAASNIILIYIAFITGNSSLEPLIEGLCAQIHVNLS